MRVYPGFAKTAREEGYADIASLWENIARIEAVHRDVFFWRATSRCRPSGFIKRSADRLALPQLWVCDAVKEAFRVCPVCGKDRGWAEGDIQTRRLGKEG